MKHCYDHSTKDKHIVFLFHCISCDCTDLCGQVSNDQQPFLTEQSADSSFLHVANLFSGLLSFERQTATGHDKGKGPHQV